MQSKSHYLERTFHYAFLVLFVISAALLLLDIDAFTGLASMKTAQVVNSCEQTIPTSTSCSNQHTAECPELNSKQYVLNQKGESLCCCVPPPEIKIVN